MLPYLVRFPVLLLFLVLFCAPPPSLRAQDPGAQQDAEAAREKLLKASDQLDNIQANSETTKLAVEGMKADVAALQASVTKLQTDNASLKQQLADTQAALDQFKAEQIKARQTLIDNVASLIANNKEGISSRTAKKKKEATISSTMSATSSSEGEAEASAEAKTPTTEVHASSLAPPPDSNSAALSGLGDGGDATPPPAPAKPHKGYYHIVASGETLPLICQACRDQGLKVTISQIEKANGMTDESELKVGQKLFIPKPGT